MEFHASYLSVSEACTRMELAEESLVKICKESKIPLLMTYDKSKVSQVCWDEKLDNLWVKRRTGREGRLPVVGEICNTNDCAKRLAMSPGDFVSWCRKNHRSLGLKIEDLQGYVPYVLWTAGMQREFKSLRGK